MSKDKEVKKKEVMDPHKSLLNRKKNKKKDRAAHKKTKEKGVKQGVRGVPPAGGLPK